MKPVAKHVLRDKVKGVVLVILFVLHEIKGALSREGVVHRSDSVLVRNRQAAHCGVETEKKWEHLFGLHKRTST